MEQPPLTKAIRERDPINGHDAAAEHSFARARYEYLITRRDQMQDRLRFGALALNGTSLAGLLAAMSSDGKAAAWAGLTTKVALWSASAFVLGLTCSGVAAIITSNRYVSESADAFTRYMTAKRLASIYEGPNSDRGWQIAEEAMNEHHASPLVDFQYSMASIVFQNLAHACWLGGVCLPLLTKLFG